MQPQQLPSQNNQPKPQTGIQPPQSQNCHLQQQGRIQSQPPQDSLPLQLPNQQPYTEGQLPQLPQNDQAQLPTGMQPQQLPSQNNQPKPQTGIQPPQSQNCHLQQQGRIQSQPPQDSLPLQLPNQQPYTEGQLPQAHLTSNAPTQMG
ncbi:uncharacterized protein LOC131803223 [Musca domestica]|uniref:Uncharacterized protein LOC131803223 n=1 Tax=Musca domestica TaxID=7370 RepID=A0ABM3V3F5_MUSDO|nr:uncharacterized protein LOC131803223 [Musca domestica]